MRLILLATIAALLVRADALSSTKASTLAMPNPLFSINDGGNAGDNHGRSLRSTSTSQEDNTGTETSSETEERNPPPSFSENLVNELKLSWWSFTNKDDTYVKEQLGFKDLEEQALALHPNYQAYKNDWYLSQLLKWLWNGDSSYRIWRKEGLDAIDVSKIWPVVDSQYLPNFRTYIDRVLAIERNLDDFKFLWYILPPLIDAKATQKELNARAIIWAATDKPDDYVQKLLETSSLDKNEANKQYEVAMKSGLVEAWKTQIGLEWSATEGWWRINFPSN